MPYGPYLDEASEALGETIHLARLDGMDVAYLATRESHEYLRTISRVGRRLPAHAGALGKALLAERPDSDLPEGPYEALTPSTHTTRDSLAADLAAVRARGYAVDREEGVPGIIGFGFALRYDTPAQDAISCSVPVGPPDPGARAPDRGSHARDPDGDRGDEPGRGGVTDLALRGRSLSRRRMLPRGRGETARPAPTDPRTEEHREPEFSREKPYGPVSPPAYSGITSAGHHLRVASRRTCGPRAGP